MNKYIKLLSGSLDWSIWKRKIRDLLDYHEGTLDVIDKNLVRPLELKVDANPDEIRKHIDQLDLYRKAIE